MSIKPIVFTPTLFFKYAVCPHWVWHDIFSDPMDKGEMPELTLKLFEQGVLHEKEYIEELEYTQVEQVNLLQAFDNTLALMKAGEELIYQGVIQYEENGTLYQGRPDLLKKVPGKSNFGDFYYQPIEIKSSKEIKQEQKYQLVFCGIILERLQGIFPKESAIINKDKETIPFLIDSKECEKTVNRIEEILRILKGSKPPLKLVSNCKNSPWFKKCVSEAEEKNDVALLYHLDCRSHRALRNYGINTVSDAASMDVDSLPKIPFASEETLERVKIQAQSLEEKKLKWLADPRLPQSDLKIFFDIEGDPLLQSQYLFGFWISGDSDFKYAKIGNIKKYENEGKYFLYFLAEEPDDEETLCKQFLEWLDILPDEYIVFHYANYEKTWITKLAEKYGGSEKFSHFHSKLFDLEDARKDSVIFPLYFYSIKDIAKSRFINFKWRHEKAGGAQSIFWYEKWLEEKDPEVLKDIINYNEDDVRATEFFYLWLSNFKENQKQIIKDTTFYPQIIPAYSEIEEISRIF